MEKLQVEYLNIEDLKAYEKNARTHSEEQIEQLCSSIREFGFTNPVLIDEKNELIAGHGRCEAAKKLGLKTVPVIRLKNLTEIQVKALRIADNQLALNAGWDTELLSAELATLQVEDFDMDLLGFSLDEISHYLDVADEQEECSDGEVTEPPKEPKTKTGDVWILGNHRLCCGDSTSSDDMSRLMGEETVDLFLTDPPYNVNYEGGTEEALKIENDSMSDSDFRAFLFSAFAVANEVMKPGAAFYIWHADSEGFNFRGVCRDVDWTVRECLIWVKNAMVLGRQDYQWRHEPCLYGWKEGAPHNWYSDRKQTTVLEFNKPLRNGEHPTMKPVDLFAYLIRNSSKRGDVVLDSFGGSGTTLVACENLGRSARLMELDPRYCDVIINRFQEMTGEQAIRESDGVAFDDVANKSNVA